VKEQPATWVTVKVCPATVRWPVRVTPLELAATVYNTAPLAAKEVAEVMVIHAESLDTCQEQGVWFSVTRTRPSPPTSGKPPLRPSR